MVGEYLTVFEIKIMQYYADSEVRNSTCISV